MFVRVLVASLCALAVVGGGLASAQPGSPAVAGGEVAAFSPKQPIVDVRVAIIGPVGVRSRVILANGKRRGVAVKRAADPKRVVDVLRLRSGPYQITARPVNVDGARYVPALACDARVSARAGQRNRVKVVWIRAKPSKFLRISVGPGGCQGQMSDEPIVSADGSFVAFSAYDSLLPGGARDRFSGPGAKLTGAYTWGRGDDGLRRVSQRAGRAANADSWATGLSADGRFVTFTTNADNLGLGSNSNDVYVWDRTTSSVVAVPAIPNRDAVGESALSADGRYVVLSAARTVGFPEGPLPTTSSPGIESLARWCRSRTRGITWGSRR